MVKFFFFFFFFSSRRRHTRSLRDWSSDVCSSDLHLASRFEADAADRGELVGGQRRAPGAAGPDFRHPGFGRGRQFIAHGPSLIEPASTMTLLVFRVPFPVSLLHRFQRAGRRFPGRKRTEPVLARGGAVVVLDGVRPEAVPPSLSLFTVH